MGQIAFQVTVITKAASAAAELFAVIDRVSLIDPMSDTGTVPASYSGRIEVRDVGFAYPSRPDSAVLSGLSLDIPANKTTALVGASGSGKSTIIGLLERWYDQTEGSILLDGLDIRDLNVRWLRTHVRLVQQEPVLFSGTVFENVSNGLVGTEHEGTSSEKRMQLVEEACKAAFAHDFIVQLPDGYHTQIGERARTLSGGQRQRIAIARSIISNPTVLLLDEATSALDPKAEKVVQEALDNVSKSRTTLTIAHKLSTIQKADNIAVMSQGAVIEQGTHRELLGRDGAYSRLVSAQSLERATEEEDSDTQSPSAEDLSTPDEDLDPRGKLTRLTTASSVATSQQIGNGAEVKESMGYSLVRCLAILIREQPKLWSLYFALAVVSLGAGKSSSMYKALTQPVTNSRQVVHGLRKRFCSLACSVLFNCKARRQSTKATFGP